MIIEREFSLSSVEFAHSGTSAKSLACAARLIIAPHEISEKHLDSIQVWARDNGLSAARLDDASVPSADVVIATLEA